MKQRIVQGLQQLADPAKYANGAVVKFMLPDLAKTTGLPPTEIPERAKQVLTRILHGYDDFSVRTIDSFVSRIIRTFAHDLHLPVDFEIEMDRDIMLDEAVEQLISKAGVDKELTRILIDFTEARSEDEKSWNIEEDIKKTAAFLFAEGSQHFLDKLRSVPAVRLIEIAREIRMSRKAFIESISIIATQAKKLITDNQIDTASFARGNSGIGNYFFKLADGIIQQPNSYVQATITEDKWIAAKADVVQAAAINSIKHNLTAIYQKCINLIEKGSAHNSLLGMIEKNIFQMGVLSAMEQEIDTIRIEKRILHISEFNKRITDIILREPVPFIYERIGEKYYNYLIDEFQDTSELQWKNLLPLIGDSLAYNRYNLVVGDGKQAIYRFRNGQVEQFMMLPNLPEHYEYEVFHDVAGALRANYRPENLNSNFRSLPEIINFNNDFFDFVSTRLNSVYSGIYNNHRQKKLDSKSGGLVSVEFLPHGSRADFDEVNIKKVHQLIIDLNSKGFSNADIAILTRSNREGSIIARYLMAKGVNVVSAEALLLASSPGVNFLINVLRHLSQPYNLVHVVAILNELISRNKLNASLIQHFPHPSMAIFPLEKTLELQGIQFSINKLTGLPLYDLVEEIIRIFSLNEEQYDIYIQFFLDFVNKVSARQGTQLTDLLEAWDEKKKKLSVVVPEGIDAIRIMTIHKSKGLEFPVVIWPMATEKHKTTFDQLWVNLPEGTIKDLPVALLQTSAAMEEVGFAQEYDKERSSSLLDMINLIYVAFTRAAERLYVLTREPSATDAGNLPGLLSEFIAKTAESWKQDGNQYLLGDDSPRLVAEHKLPMGNTLNEMISVPWQNRIRIARRAPSFWSAEQTDSRQAWGTLIHDTIAAVRTLKEVDETVEKQALLNQLSPEEKEILRSRVINTLSHVKLKQHFTEVNEIKPEAGILTPDGNVFRPDRVIFYADETVIMEFKTGKPEPEKHRRQLDNYAVLLGQMGYKGIKRLLVYIDETVNVEELE